MVIELDSTPRPLLDSAGFVPRAVTEQSQARLGHLPRMKDGLAGAQRRCGVAASSHLQSALPSLLTDLLWVLLLHM